GGAVRGGGRAAWVGGAGAGGGGGAGGVAAGAGGRREGAATGRPQGRDAGAGTGRWPRQTVTLLALAGAAAGIAILLVGAVSSRHAGQAITGNSVPGAAPVAGRPGGSAPASQSGRKSPTPQELAAVAAAE